ncbi:hypothetical protein MNJPNG_06555 [Cupriavidus oxalaticus]|uniref:tripartite tricarboxylate transporter substrate-binding protein n=1 Tax=Cupriavidus oxalaticus TaxID=96344 RepID=UPI003F731B61
MPPSPNRLVETDVVVIGGGSAGAHAALQAQADGLRVLMIVKGFLGRSGASIFAGNLQLTETRDPEATERFIQIRCRYGSSYLSDQDYLRRVSQFTERTFFPDMEKRGLYIRRHDDGQLVTSGDRKAGNVWAPNQGFSGTFIMELLRKDVLVRGIPLLQETMVTSLLTHEGRIAGVTAYDIVRGEWIVVRAKAVIVATGPSNYLSTRATGTREQCANGLAMAWRAGAELQDIEMQWFHASDIAAPRSWMRLHIYPNPMPNTDKTVRLYGSDREMFFHQGMYPKAKQPYYLQLRNLYHQVRRGNANWTGGYYGGCPHIEPEIMQRYSYQAQFFRQLDIDINEQLVELGVANLRQPIVIDNRAGGGGTVGALTVVHADPDGYTLLFASDAELTIAPVVNAAANYNPAKDLAPISLVSSGPFMLVANPKFPPNTLQELIAYAKTNPGKVNYGSFGPGTNGHMLGEQLKAIAHIDTIHVAYKGSAPAMVDLIGGEIQYAFFSPMAALDMVKAGKIKSIAVLAPERLVNAGTIPTSAEAGLPALVGGTRFGILAPAKTPRYVIDRMHEAVKTTLASPEVKASLAQLYTLPIGSSPDEFTKFITTETGKWRKLAADIGMRAE